MYTYIYLVRLKIREENILSMKIRANDIDLRDAEQNVSTAFLASLSIAKINIAALVKS